MFKLLNILNEIKNYPRINFENNKELFDFLKKHEKEFSKFFLSFLAKEDEYFDADDMEPEEVEYAPEDNSVWSSWGDVTVNYSIKKENEDENEKWNPISFRGANFYYIIY